MDTDKLESVSNYLKETYKECSISYIQGELKGSYDFAIDTGSARIILPFSKKFWADINTESILNYLQRQENILRKHCLANLDVRLPRIDNV